MSSSPATIAVRNENSSVVHRMNHSESITGVNDFDQKTIETSKNVSPASPFERQGYINFASASLGARVLFATDEWFATADNLLKDGPPVFDEDAYCEQGKVMDGWESRRRRESGHDWCVIKLASRAVLFGVEIDTAHFTGNHVPAISLEVSDLDCSLEAKMVLGFPGALERLLHGCVQGTGASPDEVEQAEKACRSVTWKEFLPKSSLRPGYENSRMHYFTVEMPVEATHVRVNYYPDGGVARLRLFGDPLDSPTPLARPAYSPIKTGRTCTVVSHSKPGLPSRQPYDWPELSLQENGGMGLACSNKHYGDPWNLIQSTLGRDMGDGWETARHPDRPSILVRDPKTNLVASDLSDWCIIKLGSVAGDGIQRIILDTKHFRGNYPESVQVDGCYLYTESDDALLANQDSTTTAGEELGVEWFPLVPRGRMAPDSEHVFDHDQISNATRKVSRIRVTIFPDGGLSRVRVYGAPGDLQ